jgi:fatty acid desaturase
MDNAMKKNKTELKNIIRGLFPTLMACFFLCVAWIWGNREDWVRFRIFLVASIIVAMWFPAVLICQKLDNRFDRLEELLKNDEQSESGEKTEQQN